MNACPLRLQDPDWEPFQLPDGRPVLPLLREVQARRLREEGARLKVLESLRA